MIPPQVIEQIAAANDIVDVIGSYFPLKRAGTAFKALCPFHREKSPSFTVNPARQTFKCFGCDAGGTVFRFVELYESVTFPEAVKRLAARRGIRFSEEPFTSEENAAHRMKGRLLALHAEATEWFHLNLLRTKAGQIARDYLKGRGITVEVAKAWKLGYSPDSKGALTHWARERGYHDGELIASGLVTTREGEENSPKPYFYDRFRDRLMFPICNDTGETIAFSGRVLRKDAFGGKYINSPETVLFTKSKVLFGLHKAKRAIIEKSSAIVCEGQLDLITTFEAGIRNVTASQGTALTEQHAAILKRIAGEVVLCFDSDAAGLKAAERPLPALLGVGLSVRVAEMPTGHDPDSFIKEQGADAFARLIDSALDFFEYQIERFAGSPEFSTPKGKVAFARKMAAHVALISDPMLSQAVVTNLSSRLEIPAAQFTALLKKEAKTSHWKQDHSQKAQEQEKQPPLPPMSNAVRLLCQLVLLSKETQQWLLAQPWQPLLAALADAELLVKLLGGRFEPGQPTSLASLLSTFPPREQDALATLLDLPLPAEPLRVAADCWRDLERRNLEQQRDTLTARLRKPGLPLQEVINLQKQVLDLTQTLTHITRPLSPSP